MSFYDLRKDMDKARATISSLVIAEKALGHSADSLENVAEVLRRYEELARTLNGFLETKKTRSDPPSYWQRDEMRLHIEATQKFYAILQQYER